MPRKPNNADNGKQYSTNGKHPFKMKTGHDGENGREMKSGRYNPFPIIDSRLLWLCLTNPVNLRHA